VLERVADERIPQLQKIFLLVSFPYNCAGGDGGQALHAHGTAHRETVHPDYDIASYYQGAVWAWLLGPYYSALVRVHGADYLTAWHLSVAGHRDVVLYIVTSYRYIATLHRYILRLHRYTGTLLRRSLQL
jgi:hypothetical protein